ncbi:MAG: SdrD B-like domain-containing protein [Roseibacillus sp.]
MTLELEATLNAAAGYNDGTGPNGGYMFDHTSFVPTKNVGTVDWTEGDWFGTWDNAFGQTSIDHTPAPGTPDADNYPSGGEWYDVEALYLDNDEDYIYLAIVTSVPFANIDLDGDEDVDDIGIVDPRIDATRAFIRPGDVSISLFKAGTERNENNATTWSYNYGLDITDDVRPNNDNTNEDVVTVGTGTFSTSFMNSFNLGSGFYETTSDLPATASDIVYPTVGDWYTGSRVGHVQADYEHTNFDPSHPQATATLLGNATYVDYYRYEFPSGNEENDAPTYIIEAVIPRALFGASNPSSGDLIGLRWVEGCRNDGDALAPVLKVTADIDTVAIGNLVWEDLNGDGDRDAGEPGIEGVVVCLQDSNGDPVMVDGVPASSHADAISGYSLDGNLGSWSGGGLGGWPSEGPWLDSETAAASDGTNEGLVQIEDFGGDQMITIRSTADVSRALDLSGCRSAFLSFDYERYNLAWESTDQLFFEYSENGGVDWTALAIIDGAGLDGAVQSSGALPLPNTANRIRVRSDADLATKRVRLNNFNIDCSPPVPLTTTTDSSGFYYFGNADGLEASTSYRVCIDVSQAPLNGLVLSPTNAGGVTNNSPTGDDLDSDASPVGGEALIFVTSPASDENYSYDFGFTCPVLTVGPPSLSAGEVGVPYSETLATFGGVAPYSYVVTSGVLPDGLSIVGDKIQGTPTTVESQTFTITSTDDEGCVGTATFTISVSCDALVITPSTLADGQFGQSYGPVNFTAPGANGAVTWTLSSGSLPAGMSFVDSGNVGVLSGTPTEGNSFNFAVTASDTAGCVGSVNLSLEIPIASITGTTFEDTDNDDDGDVVINVTTIRLFASDGTTAIDNPNIAGTQDYVVTTTDGTYAFTNLAPEDYVVVQDQPSGFLTVTDGDTTIPGDDGTNTSTTDNSIPVSVVADETDSGNDFVEERPAAIAGAIYQDTDGDGGGDVVINVVTLTLCTDLNGDGDSDDAGEGPADNPNLAGAQDYTITTTNGTYAFTGLAPGSYVVKETQPNGYLTVTDFDSAADTGTTVDQSNASTSDNLIPATVDAGETDSGNDFVEELPAAIAGTIYEDTDGDGNGDVAINVVTLTLCTDLNGDGDSDDAGEGPADNPNLVGSQDYTVTTTNGTYAFTGLTPGSYVVKETQPNDYLTVTDLDSSTDTGTTADQSNASTGDNLIPVTVDAGETDGGNDFVEEVPVAVGNLVFSDLNNNGVYDAGEGVDGVSVQIYSAGGDDQIGGGDDVEINVGPDGILGTADDAVGGMVTASGGCYLFSNLPSGKYYILIPSSEFTAGGDLVGYLPVIGQGGDLGNDDSVDENGDDTTSDGVTSTVIDLANNAEPTKENGKDAANAVNAADDDNTDLTVDFGFVEPAAIAGTVFEDTDGDENGDVVISVVTLTLCTDLNGDGDSDDAGEGPADNPNLASTQDYTITTTDGTYAFTGLTPGSYVVKETQPNGFLTVTDLDSSADTGATVDQTNTSNSDNLIPVTVDAGETDSGNDFVEELPAAIAGTIFEDTDGDENGDVVISVVTLTLCTDLNGDGDSDDAGEGPADNPNLAGTQDYTITTTNGTYAFTGLTPGSYVVKETQPNDYLTVTDLDSSSDTGTTVDQSNASTSDNLIPVTVDAGETDGGNDFVEELPAAIAGTVFEDTDGDENGDVVISVVTLTLCTDLNGDGDSDDAGEGPADNPNLAGTQDYIVTTTDGTYSFTGLTPGSYVVKETQPNGFLTVTDLDSVVDTGATADQSNVSSSDNLISATVDAGETDSGNDFVEEVPVAVGNLVFSDLNNNGAYDAGEGVDGVSVQIFSAGGDDQIGGGDDVEINVGPDGILGTADDAAGGMVTASGGCYLFSNLPSGKYYILIPASEFTTGGDLVGYLPVIGQGGDIASDDNVDENGDDITSDGVTSTVIDLANNAEVTKEAGKDAANAVNAADDNNTDLTVDFGFVAPAVIAGTIYEDADGDGNGDVVINVVTLTLCTDLNGDGDSDDAGEGPADNPNLAGTQDYILTTTDGTYAFTGLTPGSYVVKETQPNGYVTVTDFDSATDTGATVDQSNASTSDNLIPVSVDAGETDGGNDFVEEVPVAVGNLVFTDLNNNGVYDAGEGFDGISVQIFSAGGDDQIGGGDDVEINVGPDGILGSADDAAGGMVTASGGCYLFSNLPSGKYYIVIPASEFTTGGDLVGYLPVIGQGGDIGSDDNVDENGDDVTSDGVTSTVIDLANNAEPTGEAGKDAANAVNTADDNNTNLTVDFGFVQAAAIAGTIYEDTDGDGGGDVVINVVTLTLCTDLNGDGDSDDAGEGPADNPNLAGTQDYVVTTTDGSYAFTGLAPGSYTVKETQPNNFVTVTDLDSTTDTGTTADQSNASTTDDLIPVTLDAGETDSGNDFVEIRKSDTYGAYLASYGSTLNGETALGDNPDGDIYPNALEYAFCLNAANGVPGHGEFCLEKAADGTVAAQFMRRRGGLGDVRYTLEGASTLGTPTTWSTLNVTPTVNTTDADVPLEAEKVTYFNIQSAAPTSPVSGVVRVKVEVDADASGTYEASEVFYTRIFGWQCNAYNDYECASFSSPFKEKPSLSGTFGSGVLTLAEDAGTGDITLDVSDSVGNLDLSSFVGVDGEYYLQVTSGLFEGHRFDILAGGMGSITLLNDDDIFDEAVASLNTLDGLPTDSGLNGASFEVIRYRTVDEAFDKTTTFLGEEDSNPADATRLLFYDTRKSSPGFDTLMLVGTAPDTKWIRVTDPFAQVDQGGRRLDPSMGNWIHPKSSGNALAPATTPPVEQFTFGMVVDYAQAAPMNEGFNFTGAMWPIDQSPAGPNGRDLTLVAGFDGGTSPSKSTELLFWKGDLVVDDATVTEYKTGYVGYMLADAGPFDYWLDLNDSQLLNRNADLTIESHRAVMVKVLEGDEKRSHIYPLPQF